MIGVWQIGEGLYIHCKAKLAQELIAHAWAASRASGAPVRPWPWADTYPIARLRVPAHNIDGIGSAVGLRRTFFEENLLEPRGA